MQALYPRRLSIENIVDQGFEREIGCAPQHQFEHFAVQRTEASVFGELTQPFGRSVGLGWIGGERCRQRFADFVEGFLGQRLFVFLIPPFQSPQLPYRAATMRGRAMRAVVTSSVLAPIDGRPIDKVIGLRGFAIDHRGDVYKICIQKMAFVSVQHVQPLQRNSMISPPLLEGQFLVKKHLRRSQFTTVAAAYVRLGRILATEMTI
ncbi:MAG: hypothetical protein OXG90_13510 [Gammaproteobacteria bacterium]|nr:hypothetical protein [Gammaproteobacteria bacterium]